MTGPPPPPRTTPRKPAKINYEAELASASYRKTRAGIWAVGVAVIAASGGLIGAYLKSYWQQWREAGTTKSLQALKPDGSSSSSSSAAAPQTQGQAETGIDKGSRQQAVAEVSLSDLNRSISALETVRGQLMQRKIQEEQRLLKLHERIAERKEKEDRRREMAGPGR